ncbi:MAG: hypothetical protein ACO3A5_02535 [Bacteroidia bacterium]|jgi:hypothetical protein
MRKYISILGVIALFNIAIGQQPREKKWANSLSISTTPNWSSALIVGYQPDIAGGFTESQLRDSFSKSDRSLKTFNFDLNYHKKINGYSNFVFGVGMINNGFTRVKEGQMFKYVIHPDVGIYPNLVSAGLMEVHYEYRSRFIAGLFAYEKRMDGVRFQLQNASLWYQVGVMPAFQMNHELRIHTVGFEMPQGNNFVVNDYVASTVDTGVLLTPSTQVKGNAFLTASMRMEYNLDRLVHIYASPKILFPVLPNNKGVQTYFSPQIGVELGLRFPLD